MQNNTKNLKVEIKSLATKSRALVVEIRRAANDIHLQSRLQMQRLQVRYELRHLHLAYGFLRGRSYVEMERETKSRPSFDKIEEYVKKYGACRDWGLGYPEYSKDLKERKAKQSERFEGWKTDAKGYLDSQEQLRCVA